MLLLAATPLVAVAADDRPTLAPKLVAQAIADEAPPVDNSLGLTAHEPEPCEQSCHFGPWLSRASGSLWFRGDYVYYWTQGMHIPPMVTTGPRNSLLNSTTDPAGSLERSDTTILWGNSNVLCEGRSAYHINTGLWLDGCHTWALEVDWLDLGPQTSHYQAESDAAGGPIYARPYYDVNAARQWRSLVSYPATFTGSVSVDSGDHFDSIGVALRKRCFSSCGGDNDCPSGGPGPNLCGDGYHMDWLVGYRHYGLTDYLTIHEDKSFGTSRFLITDSFRAANQFHGGEIGMISSVDRGPLTLSLGLKAALGGTRQTANIRGETSSVGCCSGQGGVFAVHNPATNNGNIGTYHRNDFAVIPQIDLEVAYAVNCHWSAVVGYNLIYWASVQRSGDLYDLNVDPRNVAPPDQALATHFPQYEACGSSFWAQGLRFGLEYRY